MNNVKHNSARGLVRRFQGNEGSWGGKRYTRLTEEKKGLLARKEAKFLVFFIIRCGVALGFLNN
jgi:hypothetical protein